jgi:hypothetical protein
MANRMWKVTPDETPTPSMQQWPRAAHLAMGDPARTGKEVAQCRVRFSVIVSRTFPKWSL